MPLPLKRMSVCASVLWATLHTKDSDNEARNTNNVPQLTIGVGGVLQTAAPSRVGCQGREGAPNSAIGFINGRKKLGFATVVVNGQNKSALGQSQG